MPDRSRDGNRRPRRPPPTPRDGTGRKPGGGGVGGPRRRGALGLRQVGGNDFELVHPRCVVERELDFEEGVELRKAGDSESARDALRYALEGCANNLWVHVALGLIALEDFRDPGLARGHFGYAFELGERALPRGFEGRLPRHLPGNRPLYDAVAGLAACYEALGKPDEAKALRVLGDRWAGDTTPGKTPGS
jgi:hypothetical protein